MKPSNLQNLWMPALFILALVLTSSSWAQSDSEIEKAITHAIRGRDTSQVPPPDWWQKLDPKAAQIVVSMYEKSNRLVDRVRLLGVLAWTSNDSGVIEFLKNEALTNTNATIRETAIHSIGVSQGMKEHDFLSTQLKKGDERSKAAAAIALSDIKDPRAEATLKQALNNPRVSSQLKKKVKTHQAARKRREVLKFSATERAEENSESGHNQTDIPAVRKKPRPQ